MRSARSPVARAASSTDGTFGVTAGSELMDEPLAAAVEGHRFEAVEAAEWRNAALDFQSLATLLRSLAAPSPGPGLRASEEALDEMVLRRLAADEAVARRCADRSAMLRLWEACQTPDFRKTTLEDHLRLVRDLFGHLTTDKGEVPEDWMAERLRHLDRTDGEIDALSARLAGVRTLAYVANRPDWLSDAGHWRDKSRDLEDRLSDILHEKLMARFVDRRTSALLRGLGQHEDLLAGVGGDGTVTVEGHVVGRLAGLRFDPARGVGLLEQKALRAAAERAVAPEVNRRLGRLAAEPDEAFALSPDGLVLWRGEAAGALADDRPFSPSVRLFGELGATPARARAARRLEAFVAAEAGRKLGALKRLSDAVAGGTLRGLARGLAYRLIEAGGVIDRRTVATELRALSQGERRVLRGLGVRIGAFCLYLPSQLQTDAVLFSNAFASRASPTRALGLRGQMSVGSHAVSVATLERLDEALRNGPRRGEAVILDDAALSALGWTAAEANSILRGLGFAPTGKAQPGAPVAWRRRRPSPPRPVTPSPPGASPFSVLAALQTPPARKPRPRRRRTSAARA